MILRTDTAVDMTSTLPGADTTHTAIGDKDTGTVTSDFWS
jgi:hypothetical protein